MKNRFSASVQRYMYFTLDLQDGSRCPKCETKLEQENHAFQVISEMGGYEETFVMSGDGYFCPNCPIVVLKHDQFGEHLKQSYDHFYGPQSLDKISFGVVGFMDMDAIPDDKQHLPLDDPEMPDILVPFLVPGDIGNVPKKPKVDRKKRKQLKAKLAEHRKQQRKRK